MYLEIRKELFEEIGDKFEKNKLEFNFEYSYAYNSVIKAFPNDNKELLKNAVRDYLVKKLNAYSLGRSKTRFGKIVRFFSGLLATVLPFIKFNKK